MGFFQKLSDGLKKTKENFTRKIENIFKSHHSITESLYEELEETLILSDVGTKTASEICETLRKRARENRFTESEQVKIELKNILTEMLAADNELQLLTKPSIILVIGVNGVGKTTTIGKIAAKLKKDGKRVILAAADTFRAAAIDQLEVWAKRSETNLIKHSEGADPAAVIFDAITSAKAKQADVVICDTAGRLHNKKNLMDELSKINRIITREASDNTLEILLILDATTGQNALIQAQQFKQTTGLTGVVLTKLDGTAKGGMAIAIKQELGVPIKYIGVGEQIDDLQPFNAAEFVDALFTVNDEIKMNLDNGNDNVYSNNPEEI